MSHALFSGFWTALALCALDACQSLHDAEVRLQTRASATEASAPRSHAVITDPSEPGEPLEVTGTVFEPDGTTPAAGVVVYVYHTDATGEYRTVDDAPPRLRAWLVTNEAGRYSYRTIRPAPYPNDKIPAHVHTQMWSERFPRQWGTELEFADDPRVPADERRQSEALGRFRWVATPVRGADGTWRATHDLRLKRKAERFEDSTLHGWRDCPPELKRAAR
jgi:protocatechuate 3,4-dioxygenase beta subunit